MWTEGVVGTDVRIFLLCSSTAFKINLEESTKRLHSSGCVYIPAHAEILLHYYNINSPFLERNENSDC